MVSRYYQKLYLFCLKEVKWHFINSVNNESYLSIGGINLGFEMNITLNFINFMSTLPMTYNLSLFCFVYYILAMGEQPQWRTTALLYHYPTSYPLLYSLLRGEPVGKHQTTGYVQIITVSYSTLCSFSCALVLLTTRVMSSSIPK